MNSQISFTGMYNGNICFNNVILILLFRIKTDKTLDDIPVYKNILERFINNEIIRQADFCNEFEAELRQTDAFNKSELGEKR